MSFIGNKILLGYEDEPISQIHKEHVNFKTNKIGGRPDWMIRFPSQIRCKLCGLVTPLILQIYAPMKNSSFHRTLYIFACINPNCWNKKDSWMCMRTQILDLPTEMTNVKNQVNSNSESFMCSGSDSWGEDQNNENFEYLNDFVHKPNHYELKSYINEIDQGISQISFKDSSSKKDSDKSNFKEKHFPAIAMIEGNSGDVFIDTPTLPISDLNSLLQQPNRLPSIPDSNFEFSPFFISVDEENLIRVGLSDEEAIISKIRDYRANIQGEEEMSSISGENYEKSLPAHGDKMFHRFLTRIQANPNHIIRYGGYPLWLYPSDENCSQFHCKYCGGESAFELQILPTLIPKLFLNGSSGHLEYGSVFIYSCLTGCWDLQDPQPRDEIVIVQNERM